MLLQLFAGTSSITLIRNEMRLFRIKSVCFLFLITSVLLLPIQWVVGWIIAAAIHESGHILALHLFRVKIHSISIGITGAQIITEPMTALAELVCTLSGPIAGMSVLPAAKWLPYAALAALIQSVYNLLPVYPLDGGRAVRSFLAFFLCERRARIISKTISVIVVFCLLILGTLISERYNLGILPILFPSVPIMCTMWKNFLQTAEKNSTIRRRIIQKGNQYDFCTGKSASASAKTRTIYWR